MKLYDGHERPKKKKEKKKKPSAGYGCTQTPTIERNLLIRPLYDIMGNPRMQKRWNFMSPLPLPFPHLISEALSTQSQLI